ncbi:MAG TPA: efflux RND transporter permease subunit [Firmicutes bacterium]|nr:efflux RND transporter permease subunit [Bacillota bacterium]
MKLPEIAVRRPVMTFVIFVIVLVLGSISFSMLNIDLFPDITYPVASIVTVYEGAGAEDVEEKITKIIEGSVSTVPNIKEVTSTSSENTSAVMLQFNWGTNMDTALSDIRGALDMVLSYLPDGVERPWVFKFDISMMPVLFMSVTSEHNYKGIRTLIEEEIVDPLKRIPGVGNVSLMGGPQRQIRVYFDRDKLNDLGLNVKAVAGIIGAQNVDTPAGEITNERRNYVLRVAGEFSDPKDIEEIVVAQLRGRKVRIRDIATLSDDYFQDNNSMKVNGKNALMMVIQKQSDANTVKVAKNIREKIVELEKSLPADTEIDVVMDTSEYITDSISNLSETLLAGGIFVVLIVLLFLRNIRGSFIISLMIPVSLIVAFILMYVNGYTINIISLSALAIAVGMVVDNGIVVLENIYSHLSRGVSRREAAMFGASEVGSAILASTLTTIVIFVPIFFINDISTILFKQLGFSIMIVLAGSFFTAMLLIPMLSSVYLKNIELKGRIAKKIEESFNKMSDFYLSLLRWVLHHRKMTVVLGILVFVLSLAVFGLFGGTEFMPVSDSGRVSVKAHMPLGTSHERTMSIAAEIDALIQEKVPEIKRRYVSTGSSGSGIAAVMGSEEGLHIAEVGFSLVPVEERKRSAMDIAEELRSEVEKVRGIEKLSVTSEETGAFSSGDPISIEIYGYDMDLTYDIAEKVKQRIARVEGVRNTAISREMGKPEVTVALNRAHLSNLGLTTYDVGQQLRAQYYGITASRYREGGDEYDIFLRIKDDLKKDIASLKGTNILTPMGRSVPLDSIASISIEQGPVDIERKSQSRVVYVTAATYGRSFGEIALDVNRALREVECPDNVDIVLKGTFEDQQKSFKYLALAVLGGILLVYLVMAGQFESFRDPFVILFSIPFAFSGVFYTLPLFGINLSIIVFIGLILLVGIVVNNAIVLVDYTNLLRKREYPIEKAILEAGQSRLRPVLMTALTTIFGMLPLALSRGEGAETWRPLGLSVISGLFFSTLVTLLFVPTLYYIAERKTAKKRGELI